MDLKQIKDSAMGAFQLFVDEMKFPETVKVGHITEQDFVALRDYLGMLNWPVYLAEHGQQESTVDLTLKLVIDEYPAASMLGKYVDETNTLEIYLIESFVNKQQDHILKGRVLLLCLIYCFLFSEAADASFIHLVEPLNNDLVEVYEGYGFTLEEQGGTNPARMVITLGELNASIQKMVSQYKQ